MSEQQYYPCLMDWDTGQISRRVGPAMSYEGAVHYLKQHHCGPWERAFARPQLVSHEFFTLDPFTQKSG
jgi:hypothetical protein